MPRAIPPERRCLPFVEWPLADQAAWRMAVHPGNVLDGPGPAASWSPKTLRTVIAAYGRWLAFLDIHDWLDPNCPPADRLNEDRLRAYADKLRAQVQSITLRNRIRDLAEALRVMDPAADLRLLRRAAQCLRAQAVPSRPKVARTVELDRLAELGYKIMAEAKTTPVRNAIWRATRFRMGLMIALLTYRPLRRGNFVALTLGRHIQVHDEGVMFHLSDEETKNNRPYAVPCPATLEPDLREYLTVYRPMLLKGGKNHRLWISHMGRPLTEDGFYGEIRKVTLNRLGIALNPHAFRDSVATFLILENPANVPHAAGILGHSTTNTTNAHYNQAPAQAAYGRYHAILESLLDSDDEEETQPCAP